MISINEILSTKLRIKCRGEKQKEFIRLIENKEIVIASGPAGTGKSFASIAKAIELIQENPVKYKNLIIVKPAVEAEEELGFLPGDLAEKLAPHLASSMDILDKLITPGKAALLVENGVIKIEALGFLRGKTLDNAIVIIEEAQNMSPNQMKTLITRIGENCKYVISGDLDQSDKYSDVTKSGLYDAMKRFRTIDEIGFFEFTEDDIVRNPLISKILKTYKVEDKPIPPKSQSHGEFTSILKPLSHKPIIVKKKLNWFQRNFKW